MLFEDRATSRCARPREALRSAGGFAASSRAGSASAQPRRSSTSAACPAPRGSTCPREPRARSSPTLEAQSAARARSTPRRRSGGGADRRSAAPAACPDPSSRQSRTIRRRSRHEPTPTGEGTGPRAASRRAARDERRRGDQRRPRLLRVAASAPCSPRASTRGARSRGRGSARRRRGRRRRPAAPRGGLVPALARVAGIDRSRWSRASIASAPASAGMERAPERDEADVVVAAALAHGRCPAANAVASSRKKSSVYRPGCMSDFRPPAAELEPAGDQLLPAYRGRMRLRRRGGSRGSRTRARVPGSATSSPSGVTRFWRVTLPTLET